MPLPSFAVLIWSTERLSKRSVSPPGQRIPWAGRIILSIGTRFGAAPLASGAPTGGYPAEACLLHTRACLTAPRTLFPTIRTPDLCLIYQTGRLQNPMRTHTSFQKPLSRKLSQRLKNGLLIG